MERTPDIEVMFYFNGTRTAPIYSGYRPAHQITDLYLTSGIHQYYDTDVVLADGSAKGTITFLTPEVYPASCWIGKKIPIQEGSRIIGYALITRIFNSLLELKC